MKNFYVLEGEHTNPNKIKTILKNIIMRYFYSKESFFILFLRVEFSEVKININV